MIVGPFVTIIIIITTRSQSSLEQLYSTYTCFSYNAIVPVITSTIISENIINLLRAVFIALAADVGISDSILSQQD